MRWRMAWPALRCTWGNFRISTYFFFGLFPLAFFAPFFLPAIAITSRERTTFAFSTYEPPWDNSVGILQVVLFFVVCPPS